jgi:hypothetical protein
MSIMKIANQCDKEIQDAEIDEYKKFFFIIRKAAFLIWKYLFKEGTE